MTDPITESGSRPGFTEDLRQLVEHYRELVREQGNKIETLSRTLATTQSKLAGAELQIVELYQQLHGRPATPPPVATPPAS